MFYRKLSAVIIVCMAAAACSSRTTEPAPDSTAHAAAVLPAQVCMDTQVQLALSDEAAPNLLCGPCRPHYDCHCGEDFCTPAGLPCP